jgi:hypothetical protein
LRLAPKGRRLGLNLRPGLAGHSGCHENSHRGTNLSKLSVHCRHLLGRSIIASSGFSMETEAVKHHSALSRAWLPFSGRR